METFQKRKLNIRQKRTQEEIDFSDAQKLKAELRRQKKEYDSLPKSSKIKRIDALIRAYSPDSEHFPHIGEEIERLEKIKKEI